MPAAAEERTQERRKELDREFIRSCETRLGNRAFSESTRPHRRNTIQARDLAEMRFWERYLRIAEKKKQSVPC